MFRCFLVPILFLFAATGASLVQAETAPTDGDTTLANQYFAMAEKLAKTTQYDGSTFYYQMAGAIYEKMAIQLNTPRLWERYISCYNEIGSNCYFSRQFDKALKALNQALETGLKIFGENHPSVAQSYHRMGNVYSGLQDPDKTLECWNKALAIRLKTLGENHPDVARSYGNLALTYGGDGDVDTAIMYYEKILNILRQAYGENHQDLARAYENLGVFYGSKDADKAFDCHKNALAIRLKVLGENHPEIAQSYTNLAGSYDLKGDSVKAIEYYYKALNVWSKRFGDNSLAASAGYNNLGYAYYKRGDYQKALDLYNKVLSVRLQFMKENNPDLRALYQKFGKLYEAQNNYEKALRYYQKSIFCLIPDFVDSNIYINPTPDDVISGRNALLSSLEFKAEAFAKWARQKANDLGDMRMALSTYQLASDLIDKMRSVQKAEGSKLLLGENTRGIYEKAIQTALLVHFITKNEHDKGKAFLFAEKNKAAVLSQSLQESRARQFAGIPPGLLEKERKLKVDLAFCETEIEREKQKAAKQDKAKLRHYKDRYFVLKKDYDKLIERFEKSYPKYYALKYKTQTVSLAELQEALDDKTAVLEYFWGDSSVYAFTISKEGLQVAAIKKDSTIATMMAALANSFRNVSSKAEYLQSATRLYRILIEPLEWRIANKPRWIIIPDGELYQIPFEALLAAYDPPNVDADYRMLPYLIKQHEISYHYSATLFLKSLRERPAAHHTDLFAGFAPVFGEKIKNGNLFTADFASFAVARPDAHRYLVTRDGKTLEELNHSEQELREILAVFFNRGRNYLYREASEENFKKQTQGYKYVHVATHGFINNENPKLSNLAFSQPQDAGAKEDGILFSGETYNLGLNADLLVLSACQTGTGKLVKGEGLMALTRGFFYSGVHNIIASLWKVYDQHTSQLMVEMYRRIAAGKSYSAALREAKLKMIANPETAGPQSWASFVLIGR